MQILHASTSPYLSLQSSKSHTRGGILSPEKCLQSSTVDSNQKLFIDKRLAVSSVVRKATSTNANGSSTSTRTPENDVLQALSQIIDPDFGTDIVSCGFVKDLQIDETSGEVSFRLELTTPACPVKDMVNATITIA